jgi:receptor protein-tyrosine kinase
VADQAELQTLTQQLAQAEVQPQPLFAVASPAETSSTPVSPKSTTDAVLAFLTALVVTAELSAFWSFFRDGFSIDNIEDNVAQTLGLPVLAMVPRGQRAATEDAFRELRTNLIFRDRAGPTTKVAVLGVERGVGRTFCAIALARAVSETDTRAGLIDADLRQRAVARALSLPQVPGLSDGLNDPVYLKTHTLPGNERITVLTAGRPVGDPAGLVGGRIASVVFPRFASSEMVVLDTPATAQHPDALAVAPLCDATLIVIDPRTSHRRSTQRLLERLRQVGAHPVGVIVNRSDPESWRPAWRFWRRARTSKPTGAPPAPPTTNGHASNGTPPGRRTKKSAIR